MSERDNLIQLMAKAHLSYGRHPALRSPVPMQGDIDAMSDALTALKAAGVRLVPVEAQVGMFKAMTQSWGDGPEQQRGIGRWALGSFREDYQAMIAASPYAPPGG